MTSYGPERRFLGLDAAATPEELLGFTEGPPRDRLAIESALRDQLDRVFRHPAGRSKEAEQLRRRLREAAERVAERYFGVPAVSSRGAASPSVPARAATRTSAPVRRVTAGGVTLELTEFDRHALAVLVGCGGWNADSRARLVALASAYGVTAGGLVRIVKGLSDYARAGGARLGVEDITSGSPRMAPPASIDVDPGRTALTASAIAALADRAAPELRGGDLWSTIKLSALFGLLTLLVGVAALRVVFPDRGGSDPEDDRRRAAVAPPAPGVADPDVQPRADGPGIDTPPRALRLTREPGFRGNAVPADAADAADACPQLPRELDLVARKLTLDPELSEAAFRSWTLAIDTAATGWVLADASTRDAIRQEIIGVLHEADGAPATLERLLRDLVPALPAPGRPVDVWRGAFRAGVLGAIASSPTLPREVTGRASALRRAATPGDDDPTNPEFAEAAGRWLDGAASSLVSWIASDPRTFDAWEMWLAAQREVRSGAAYDRACAAAATTVLASATDLATEGPALDVLARLLAEADVAMSPVLRSAVLALFDDDRVTVRDLFVLTSLLAADGRLDWYPAELILPSDANPAFRRRIRDRLRDAWPPPGDTVLAGPGTPRGLEVDPVVAARWRTLLREVTSGALPRQHDELMAELLLAARLNEAAALLGAQRPARADQVLDLVSRGLAERAERRALVPGTDMRYLLLERDRTAQTPGARGQASGQDGTWAEAYEAARRSTEDKLKLLRALRSTAGSDLGPRDAGVFVRAVYRGSPHEVREVARAVLIQQFPRGPVVALGMLDQFPDAPRNESVSETIRRTTGQVLPSTRSESWPREARLALAQRALALHAEGGMIDVAAERLVDSYAVRLAAARREATVPVGLSSPQEAGRLLADAWTDRARGVIAPEPAPADLPGLERRRRSRERIADGPVQSLVAQLVGVLDAFTYVLVAERPESRDLALAVLVEAADGRANAWHVLEQAIDTERALSRLWALRIVSADEEGAP